MFSSWCAPLGYRGGLLRTLQLLDEEEDINKILDFFSYEHFYVIYCKVRRPWRADRPPLSLNAASPCEPRCGALSFGSWTRTTTFI